MTPSGQRVRARVLQRASVRMLVYHWYQGQRGLGGEILRSLLALDRSPFRRDEALLVVRLSTRLEFGREGLEAAGARLARFGEALEPVLAAASRGAR